MRKFPFEAKVTGSAVLFLKDMTLSKDSSRDDKLLE